MPDVFISYSRRDEEFVQRLREALAESGKDVWVDREDIGPAVEWRREIELGIEGADIFAFVITPDALRSEPCRREREYAVEKNKRIVPLLRHRPDGVAVPDDLASRNYIFFRTDEEFAPGLGSLLAAIDGLPEWTRRHTRLLERAENWERHDRDASYLLRGSDLRDAEGWLSEQSAHKEPQPTPLQTEYILAGRTAATRRQRRTIAAVLGALAIAIVLAIVALLQRNEAQDQRDEAERQAQISRSRELAAIADSQLDDDPELSVLLAERAGSTYPTVEAERALRAALARSHVEVVMRHKAWVGHAEFSPDGDRVVTASRDGRAALWDASTGEHIAWLPHQDRVAWAEFSDRGGLVATASKDGTARIWDAETGAPRTRLEGHSGVVSRVAFSPSGGRVVTAGEDGTARIWDVETERQLAVLKGHQDWITSLAFTADGETIVTAGDDGTVRLWDAGSGAPGPIMRPRAGPIGPLAVGPGASPRILSGSFDGGRDAAVIWDSSTGRALHRLPLAGGAALSAAFTADGRRVATGELNGTVRVWAVASGRPLATLTGHTGPISDLAFSHDGGLLVSASGDGTARLWDVGQERVVEELLGHDGWVTTAAFAPDERTILTASQDGTARIWDATAAEPREQLRTGLPSAYASFASDGDSVLTTGPAVVPILWNPETGAQDVAVSDSTLIATHAAISPDGGLIATTSENHLVGAELVEADYAQVWTAGGGLERTFRGHDAKINSVAFSPNSEAIVTASDDGTARIWDVSSGDSRTLEGSGRDVESAAFSPDGTQVLTAGTDEKARLWDAASGEQVTILRGHSGSVYSAAFSPDGELVVTGSGDNTARIWDLAGDRTRVVLTGHEDTVVAARFSADGRFVVTASHDGTARVWDAFTGEPLLEFRAGDPRLGRSEDIIRRLLRAAAAMDLDPEDLRVVADVGFDPSGERIVTASNDGAVRVYRCEICGSLDDLLETARAEVTRELTAAERREFLGE